MCCGTRTRCLYCTYPGGRPNPQFDYCGHDVKLLYGASGWECSRITSRQRRSLLFPSAGLSWNIGMKPCLDQHIPPHAHTIFTFIDHSYSADLRNRLMYYAMLLEELLTQERPNFWPDIYKNPRSLWDTYESFM